MKESCEIAIVGSGFAGSLLARILARLGYEVVLLERGTHPRFAIGESSTPLANLSLERLGLRYGLADCYQLATHGRWLEHFPELRRGLKRGFTYYRHHPHQTFENRGFDSERLLVAASPHDSLSDTHWLRADVDHHFVRQAVAAGVDYRDRVDVTTADFGAESALLECTRAGNAFELRANFVIDASGPGGFLARELSIPSGLRRTETRAALLFSHFEGMQLMKDAVPGMPEGPYPDDWAAVHHIIDEGWLYSLRFDDGVTSAGFLITPHGLSGLGLPDVAAAALWQKLLERYPTLATIFADSTPLMPIAFRPLIQHRLTRATGERWLLMPHAYAFVDPLFSTGIAWSLRAVERVALAFEDSASRRGRIPDTAILARYGAMLAAEADQIDSMVAGSYEAMTHFDLFAAHAMLYFATVSFAEVAQRLKPDDAVAWKGFLGVGDAALERLPREALRMLKQVTLRRGEAGTPEDRGKFSEWITHSIEPRNIAGLASPERQNLYPVDFDALVEGHSRLGMTREEIIAALPALRGASPLPALEPDPSSRKTGLAARDREAASYTHERGTQT